MKKTMQQTMKQIVMFLVMIGLLSTTMKAFAEERKLQVEVSKEVGAYESEQPEKTILLEDVSFSMRKVFSKEVNEIKINREEFSLYRTFASEGKTDLYGELNKAFQEADSVSIITDLWDTVQEELREWKGKDLRIYVPYTSQNEEAVEHVKKVVYQHIQSYFLDSFVKVVYLDETEIIMLQSETAILRDKMRNEEEQEEEEQEEENIDEKEPEQIIEKSVENKPIMLVELEPSVEDSTINQPISYVLRDFLQENWKKILLIFLVIFCILVIVTKCRNIILEILKAIFNKLGTLGNEIRLFFEKTIVKRILQLIILMIAVVQLILCGVKHKEMLTPNVITSVIAVILLIGAAGVIFGLREYLEWNWETHKIRSIVLTLLVTVILTGIVIFFWINEPAMRVLLIAIGILVCLIVEFVIKFCVETICEIGRIVGAIIAAIIRAVIECIKESFEAIFENIADSLEMQKEITRILKKSETIVCMYPYPLKGFSFITARKISKAFKKKNVMRFSTLEELTQLNEEKKKNVVLILRKKDEINLDLEGLQVTVISPDGVYEI